MDPITIGTILAVTSSAIGGIASYSQSQYQAEIAKNNAKIAEENAQRAFERGQAEALDNDREIGAFIGEQTAAQSASGLSLSGKSQVLTRKASSTYGRLDSLRIMQAADVERYNYQTEAANFEAEADMAKTQGALGLVGTALDMGASIANYKANKSSSMVSQSQPTSFNTRFNVKPVPKPRRLSRILMNRGMP